MVNKVLNSSPLSKMSGVQFVSNARFALLLVRKFDSLLTPLLEVLVLPRCCNGLKFPPRPPSKGKTSIKRNTKEDIIEKGYANLSYSFKFQDNSLFLFFLLAKSLIFSFLLSLFQDHTLKYVTYKFFYVRLSHISNIGPVLYRFM